MTHTEILTRALELLAVSTFYNPELQAKRTDVIEKGLEALAQPDQYAKGYADAMNWKVQNHLEHLPTAQPEQEPVAWFHPHKGFYWAKPTSISAPTISDVKPLPLYATSPQRTWVGLTLEQYVAINQSCVTVDQAICSTERQLKENNT